ncbi:hypothetical protein BpHYR1_024128 [Brachionus plicatilis]|uniref:Uncharacterized protein n=1 Tax=Brachionus plicatilis TaxID=10195 RepID=A0A3M7TAV9_BRAPC|nr:hypothetical protein BpHYR1_024128 [Brachionus plicatilis]
MKKNYLSTAARRGLGHFVGPARRGLPSRPCRPCVRPKCSAMPAIVFDHVLKISPCGDLIKVTSQVQVKTLTCLENLKITTWSNTMAGMAEHFGRHGR